jgi:hypothetical protein
VKPLDLRDYDQAGREVPFRLKLLEPEQMQLEVVVTHHRVRVGRLLLQSDIETQHLPESKRLIERDSGEQWDGRTALARRRH